MIPSGFLFADDLVNGSGIRQQELIINLIGVGVLVLSKLKFRKASQRCSHFLALGSIKSFWCTLGLS